MDLLTVVTWATLAMLPAFLVLDLVYRARGFRTDSYWRLRALIVTAVAFGVSIIIPMGWAALLGEWTLFNLSRLGIVAGAVAGIVIYEFCHYWYHRTVHRNDRLWRWLHQMHHSAESLDAFGANYISPLDAAMFVSMATLVFGPVLGLSGESAAIGGLFLTFCAVFQHANIRTPRWLGYIVQRPESHGVHHERGVHAWNYSDLPLWDIAFGTFRNPARWEGELGFYDGASRRIGDMLLARDVSEPDPIDETQSRPVAA
jgi:sterol desaturase/sphingolipid hydroxylase (fatty acid hydroxylase superfamily)